MLLGCKFDSNSLAQVPSKEVLRPLFTPQKPSSCGTWTLWVELSTFVPFSDWSSPALIQEPYMHGDAGRLIMEFENYLRRAFKHETSDFDRFSGCLC